MLSSLALAAALDPAWPAPQEKLRETMQFLRSMNDLVVHKVSISRFAVVHPRTISSSPIFTDSDERLSQSGG